MLLKTIKLTIQHKTLQSLSHENGEMAAEQLRAIVAISASMEEMLATIKGVAPMLGKLMPIPI